VAAATWLTFSNVNYVPSRIGSATTSNINDNPIFFIYLIFEGD
jgi:hypothetical protein